MNKQLLDVIKQLSTTDEKTLVQKTLKLGEEFGELAKKVLPFEGSFATNHRFVTDLQILEEVADVMLCALSVAYNLGFSDDDIEDMMSHKSIKWNKLQQEQLKGKFPLPFEIHVTVHIEDFQVDEFKRVCSEIGVKPIVLDLTKSITDVMTSSVIMTDNAGAYKEMKRISDSLTRHGIKVIREKIETVPWHPAAPQTFADDMPPGLYFESHINIVVNGMELDMLKRWMNVAPVIVEGHLSKNVFKRINEHDFVQMLTVRSSTIEHHNVSTSTYFTQYVNRLVKELNQLNFLRPNSVLKHVVEYAIYDTNVSHDLSWVNPDTKEN